ncbi:MAG: hypothetical protein ACI9M3_001377 [Bacteroidia bacterium]|jgi:hypothetical protein
MNITKENKMKNRITEICELGNPSSIIQRLNQPITEIIKTKYLIEELNIWLDFDAFCKSYTENDMDNAYDKGFNDGNQRDRTGSLIEIL